MSALKFHPLLPLLVGLLAAPAASADQVWDGGAGTARYLDPVNWQGDRLPSHDERIVLNSPGGRIRLESGEVVSPRKILGPGTDAGKTTLHVNGGRLTNSSYWDVGITASAQGVVTLNGAGSEVLTRDLRLGVGGGSGTLNISEGVLEVYGVGDELGFRVPGDAGSTASVNVSGGVLRAAQLTLAAGGRINLSHEGRLELRGDQRAPLNEAARQGRLTAEGGRHSPQISFNGKVTTVRSPGVPHAIVAHDPTQFLAWPANNGIWQWDNEILVGFNSATFDGSNPNHNYSGDIVTRQARSRDGGVTWTTEDLQLSNESGLHETLDFLRPDFAFKARGSEYFFSHDRGQLWRGPFSFPGFGVVKRARTDYVVNSQEDMLVLMSARISDAGAERAFAARTRDGGRTFTTQSWMTPSPLLTEHNNSTMPSTVRIGDGQYISAIRQRQVTGNIDRKWIDIYRSVDDGASWHWLSRPSEGAWNPAKLLALPDGRTLIVYGHRGDGEEGLRARLSSDDGQTWGSETRLRTDGLEWDLGYPQAVVRADGAVVIVYYYITSQVPYQHIASTTWYP